jgi:hypothetical protein
MDEIKKITYEDKVRKDTAGSVPGTTDTFRYVDANEIKDVVNQNAENLGQLSDDFNALYSQINPFTQSFSLSPTLKEVGDTTAVSMSWTHTIAGQPVTPETLSLKKGATVLTSDTAAKNFTDQGVTSATAATITYTLSTTYKGQSKQNSGSIQFVNASYNGIVTDLAMTATIAKTLTKAIRSSKSSTQSGLTWTAKRYAYVYPKAFGTLVSIKDGNGFEYMSGFTMTTLQIDNVDYYAYVMTEQSSVSNFRFIFS